MKIPPTVSIFFVCFALVLSKIFVSNLSMNLECFIRNFETGSRKSSMKNMGSIVPVSAQKKLAATGRPRNTPSGRPMRSSPTGRAETSNTISSVGRWGTWLY